MPNVVNVLTTDDLHRTRPCVRMCQASGRVLGGMDAMKEETDVVKLKPTSLNVRRVVDDVQRVPHAVLVSEERRKDAVLDLLEPLDQ